MTVEKPNVVLVVLDTHRVDRLGCYGYPKGTTPNIDSFAKNATIYEKAISPAQWTIPAHASLFTGEYPSTHNIIQADDGIGGDFYTLAEFALGKGYETIGLCNNPLVGVLDNGFRRGFQQFHNYGGTVPSPSPFKSSSNQSLIENFRESLSKIVDVIATPIQQMVAVSPEVLRFSLNPLLVPIWTRYSNFKGNTAASINDAAQFISNGNQQNHDSPQFIFLNLMETHLPFTPPKRFIDEFSPIVKDNPESSNFMSEYNTQALKWLLPLDNPYQDHEAETLWSMYDAEVAYQDWLLNQLLTVLDQPKHRDNTLVIFVGDHGEMLGEHQIMGHALGVYEELVHVPLLIRFPGQTGGTRVRHVVSTTQIFHTILDEIGIKNLKPPNGEMVSTPDYSLKKLSNESAYVFSEAHTPLSLLIILEKYAPELIEQFNCRSTRWAVYNHPYKLIRTESIKDNVYDYLNDPSELNDLSSLVESSSILAEKLEEFLVTSTAKGIGYKKSETRNLVDEEVADRLRKLGYID